MRSLGGFVLLAGIGVGLFVYMPAPVDSETSLDHVQRLAATRAVQRARSPSVAPIPVAPIAPVSRLRSFSPAIALVMPARRKTPARALSVAKAEPAPVAPAPTTNNRAQIGWQTVVASQSASLAPADPDARYKLVLDIQQQLRRVGCYYGRIDGSWGAGTKYAMKEFTDRVNAALPLDEPDYLLLTLIQTHSEKTCGACPAGQSLSAGGRCVPQPITAQAKRANEPQVAAAQKEVLPWKTGAGATAQPGVQPLFKPVPTSVVSSEPLPGRMAIGGPKALPPVDAQTSQPVVAGTVTGPDGVATAALDPNGVAPKPVTAPTSKSRSSSSGNPRPRRRDGPGSPRYNLMLSLGGVY